MVVKSPDWRSVMARGELFLCLKVKDGSFLVDEVVCSVDSPLPSGLDAFYLNLGRRSTLSIGHRCSIKAVMCGEQLKVIVEKKLVVKVQLEKGPVLDVCFVMDCCRGFLKVFVVIVNGWFRCGYLLLMKKSSALCARLLSS
ncbi:hypothetical protein F2Q68_00011678 [Brassica cretica]|uniref:Uncharacterized protein n=1 Tax=Brassica cretica TaxID=69181 RepID=A0A8S9L264_BRACR|nr:hypothetical protein F2Q68_00011678 [Brassica cretica]